MNAVKIILIAAGAIIFILFIACIFIFNQLVWVKTIPIPKIFYGIIAGNSVPGKFEKDVEKAVSHFEEMPLERPELTAKDGAHLRAKLLIPEKSNGRLIIACHGARSSGIGEFCFMADYFYNNGYTVLMPEHRGCGKSDGKFMGYGTHESKDTFLWLDYANKRFPSLSVFLLGVSMGGATVLMMSDKIKNNSVKGIIADCPYTCAWDEFSYQLHTSFHLPDFPLLHICNLYSMIFSKYSFKAASPIEAVKNSRVPVLFIHGKADEFVPFFMQKQLYDACTNEKYILSVDDAVHARSYYTNPGAYEQAINRFFDKYDN